MKVGTPTGLAALTGIRALAAAWVVIYHLRGVLDTLFPGVRQFTGPLDRGYLGVDLFFVLSGFILTINYASRFETLSLRTWAWFLGLRLARIYPLHLVTLALMVALVSVARLLGIEPEGGATAFGWVGLVWSVLLLHAWGIQPDPVWNAPSWSISAEWWAYLWFPLLMAGVGRMRGRSGALVGLALAWVALLAALWLRDDGMSLDLRYHGALVRVSGEFLMGMFAAAAVMRGLLIRSANQIVLVSALLAAALATSGSLLPVLPLTFCFLIAGLTHSDGWLAKLLASRIPEYLGRTSFALYLVHQPMIIILGRLIPLGPLSHASGPVRLAGFAAWWLAMNVASFLLYHWVEEPSREWVRRRVDVWKPGAAAPASR